VRNEKATSKCSDAAKSRRARSKVRILGESFGTVKQINDGLWIVMDRDGGALAYPVQTGSRGSLHCNVCAAKRKRGKCEHVLQVEAFVATRDLRSTKETGAGSNASGKAKTGTTKSKSADLLTDTSSRKKNLALQIVFGERPIIGEGDIWDVPSQSDDDTYQVNLKKKTCECADWRKHRRPCKHIYAAAMHKAKVSEDEIAVVESIPNPYKNPPYYDHIMANSDRLVAELLRCLGARIPYVPHNPKKKARRCLVPLGDIFVCAALGTLDNKPSRKIVRDPEYLAFRQLLRGPAPCSGLIRKAFLLDELTKALNGAIRSVGDCVKYLETDFALDAKYFKTPNYEIKIEQRAGKEKVVVRSRKAKLQWCVGRLTLVPVAVEVADGDANDQLFFDPLFDQIADRFVINGIHADAGYCAAPHFERVAAVGGTAWIDFKEDSKPQKGFPHFNDMLKFHRDNYDDWKARYNPRSLIETANSVLGRTIKRVVRARTFTARKNEMLLMVLIYGLVRLLFARKKYGIHIPFADERAMREIDAVLGAIPEALKAA